MTKYIYCTLILLIALSCVDEDMSFDIGSQYTDVKTNIRFTDTLKVKSYTVVIDSIPTSGYSEIVTGKYADPDIGDITAQSYFRIGLNSSNLPDDAVYDSIQLILLYNDYYVGDTNVVFTINVHRLTDKLKGNTDDGKLYNNTTTGYNPELFGSISFIPEPHDEDSVKIPLLDSFGEELLNLIVAEDMIVRETEEFIQYFKGLVLSYDNANNAMMGFQITESVPFIRLYYHYYTHETLDEYLDFPLTETTLQYNKFQVQNPKVANFPTVQRDALPASLSGDVTFVQGGTGIVTRFEIPYLKNILTLHNNVTIVSASLVIEPAKNTYRDYDLPEEVSLYSSNYRNHFVSPIYYSDGSIQSGVLVIDKIYQEESTYTFDVTSFITSKLTEETDDYPSLLLTIKPDRLYTTLDRLVVGSQSHSENTVTLKIYYMDYE